MLVQMDYIMLTDNNDFVTFRPVAVMTAGKSKINTYQLDHFGSVLSIEERTYDYQFSANCQQQSKQKSFVVDLFALG